MDLGHIKTHRELMNKAFYKDSEKVHLWLHLLLKANWSEREEMFAGKPIKCKAGQFTTGRKQLSIETGINESKIERILTYFEKIEHQIEQQKSSVNRLISIVNWCRFQQSEQRNEQQVNSERTTSEQRVNTLKEVKEVKESKEHKEVKNKEGNVLFDVEPIQKPKKTPKPKPEKKIYGEFKNVSFTDSEYQKLILKYTEQTTKSAIEIYSTWKESKGVSRLSDYSGILANDGWPFQRAIERNKPSASDQAIKKQQGLSEEQKRMYELQRQHSK